MNEGMKRAGSSLFSLRQKPLHYALGFGPFAVRHHLVDESAAVYAKHVPSPEIPLLFNGAPPANGRATILLLTSVL